MHSIRLDSPIVSGNTVLFRWSVEPYTSLYYGPTRFELRFPPEVQISAVPEGLWLRIALICLHSHWLLLRPCRVDLPVTLGDGETEFWLRLIDAEVAALEAQRGSSSFERTVEIRGQGPTLAPFPVLPEGRRCAAAFSGGKDSLLQAALLCELLEDPILVATTSPLPPMEDHLTGRRAAVFAEIAKRRAVSLVEVQSDFRSTWDNEFGRRLGYPVWVSEITDTFLYLSALLAVGFARNVPHLFLASENEVQETIERDGRVLQHTHFMYSVATLQSIAAVLRPSGVTIGSTTAALHSSQVERLLRKRYRDLADFQYSCPAVTADGFPCSACSKCFRAALCALAAGDSPLSLGIDLVKLLTAMRHWVPAAYPAGAGAHPGQMAQADLSTQVVRFFTAIPFSRVASELRLARPDGLTAREGGRALLAYALLRRRISRRGGGGEPGYNTKFLSTVDPLARDGLESIFREHFPADETSAAGEAFGRSDSLSRWIAEPLA